MTMVLLEGITKVKRNHPEMPNEECAKFTEYLYLRVANACQQYIDFQNSIGEEIPDLTY